MKNFIYRALAAEKKILLIACAAMASMAVWAQDIIVTKDAKKIDAKILEVSKSEIKYKEFTYQDGPTFILNTSELVTIIYANGKVELYNQDPMAYDSERRAREAAAAAERAKQAEAIAKANQMGSLYGNTGSGDGSGQKGNPVGHGSSAGNSWSLSGRGIKSLPQPSNTFNQEGRVIVEIRVNAKGDVISATHKGGTVNDKKTIQLAIDAARKTKFTEGDHDQIGSITYNFKFN